MINKNELDNEYLNSIRSLFPSQENKSKMKEHQTEMALFKAKNVKRRQAIFPIVQQSLSLLSSAFARRKDKKIIPKFYNFRPDYPLSLEPNFTIDNFIIDRFAVKKDETLAKVTTFDEMEPL